jgi:hypothetical protein
VKIIKRYDHKNALAFLEKQHPGMLDELIKNVEAIDIGVHKTKVTKETGQRFTLGQLLYSPVSMNGALAQTLRAEGWHPSRITLASPDSDHTGFREIDGLKEKVGLEIQFGKYAFMGYDILGKFPIFASRGIIEVGIELVPMKELAMEMSSGVSHYEQITADLHARGVADLDVPTVILGLGFKDRAAAPSQAEQQLQFGLDSEDE